MLENWFPNLMVVFGSTPDSRPDLPSAPAGAKGEKAKDGAEASEGEGNEEGQPPR